MKILVGGAIVALVVLLVWYISSRRGSGLSLRYSSLPWKGTFDGDWMTTWGVSGKGSFGYSNQEVVYDPSAFVNVLRVCYPQGSASPEAARADGCPLGGCQFQALPVAARDSVHLRYYVKFDPNFDFVKGGKLPGLYGGTAISGGDNPDGTNGFSTRLMWRTSGAGEVYAYLPGDYAYGASLGRGSWVFQPGTWYCVEQGLKLNTPGQNDGSVTIWVNGAKVFTQTGLLFRTVSTLQIEGIFFSTFFGGNDSSWATPATTYANFCKFALSSSYIGQ